MNEQPSPDQPGPGLVVRAVLKGLFLFALFNLGYALASPVKNNREVVINGTHLGIAKVRELS